MLAVLLIDSVALMALSVWLMAAEAVGKKPNRPWPLWAKISWWVLLSIMIGDIGYRLWWS